VSKLKKQITFETTFGLYLADELLGEGGAGRVFGGFGPDQSPVAIKVLAEERASTDKRRRFKNEIAFLSRNKHANIVPVIDHGVTRGSDVDGPFYVMPRYDESLREPMRRGLASAKVLPLFSQIMDGVEAAHLHGVVHRDLKPENILYDRRSDRLAIADFGIAHFTEELVATIVETAPSQRLANFQYAAPEQRTPGQTVTAQADIYALGLILNEMFTGIVPQGTQYRLIENVDKDFGFLDQLVSRMLSQVPGNRPVTIGEAKGLIQRYRTEAVSLQRISSLDGSVIRSTEVDEPLAHDPPRLINADWNRGQLILTLDRPVTQLWVQALSHMGGYSAVMGRPPESFSFSGARATVSASEHEVQAVIDHFKSWLPQASRTLKQNLEEAARRLENQRREQLRKERAEEESRLRVLGNIRI
jgi:serine/threonine protein kinase